MTLLRLTAALLAGLPLAAAAQPLSISPNGTGQALYLPYYTVEDDQATLISLSNNTGKGKAVRVALDEAHNGQHVLVFNVYLAPRDSWSAALVHDDGNVRLVSQDDSCTVPSMPPEGFEAVNYDYDHWFPDGIADAPTPRRVSGAIELIEMGEVDASVASNWALNCPDLVARWTEPTGVWTQTPNEGVTAPAGGLSATSHIVNVAAGTVFTLPAVAIEGFASTPQHASTAERFPRFAHPVAGDSGYVVNAGGRTLTFAADRGADAMSALFMASALLGDFHLEPELGATTQWVLAFPTRSPYVSNVPGSLVGDSGAQAPFTRRAGDSTCERAALQGWDVDGQGVTTAGAGVDLCRQTQLVTFSRSAGGGTVARVDADVGRARLRMDADRPPLQATENGAAVSLAGLPVIGYRMSRYINGTFAGNVLANYTDAEPLQRERPTSP